jgi:hypothetical protein
MAFATGFWSTPSKTMAATSAKLVPLLKSLLAYIQI